MFKLSLTTTAIVSAILATATGANAQSLNPIAPGSMVVHLNGYLQFGGGSVGGDGMSGGTGATAYKNNSVGTIGDVRLYPGFDGSTINGIDYGVQVELRTTSSNANGTGVNNNSTNPNGTGDIYVRRAYSYIGNATYGYVRFGQGDGAFELLQSGVIEAFGDGAQFNSDGGLSAMLPSGKPGDFIYGDQGALYTTDKIVYVSPAVEVPMLDGKFSAIVSYEPNSNGLKEGAGTIAGDVSQLNSAVAGGSGTRRLNTLDGMIGYSVKMGRFATKICTGYLASSPMGNLTGTQEYAPMGVWQVGAQTTYTGVFTDADTVTIGANIKGGSVVDGYDFRVRGGRNALAYIIGGDYTNARYVIGASFFDSQTAAGAGTDGDTAGKTLDEYGIAVGGNYIVAKPLSLYLQYEYGHKHAYNIAPQTSGQAQGIAAGATFKW